MADVFEEVEEQLRSARYETIIKKGWPYLVGALVIGVLATIAVWAWNKQQLGQSAKASEAYQEGLDAIAKGDAKTAEARFAAVAADAPPAYKALALMQQADLRVKERKTADAVALLDKAAAATKDPILSDSARLKAIYLTFDDASLADVEKRVEPLTQAGRPFTVLAREALAVKRMVSGKTAEARQALSLLAISPDTNQGLQARANVAMGVIDAGQAATVPATAKAAAALTPEQVAQFQQQQAMMAAIAQAQQQRQAGQQPGVQPGAPAGAPQ